MTTTINRRISIGIIALAVASQSACSRPFYLRPAGDLRSGVVFRFYDTADAERTSTFSVVSVVVQKQTPGDSWDTIWSAVGRQNLNELLYGRRYDGLRDEILAKEIQPGARYRVFVKDGSWIQRGADAEFSVDEEGRVVVR